MIGPNPERKAHSGLPTFVQQQTALSNLRASKHQQQSFELYMMFLAMQPSLARGKRK
jgi:hypothetical protein